MALFSDYDLFSVLEGQKQRLVTAIEQAPAELIRSVGPEELATRFVAEFRVVTPELTEAATSVSVEETPVDVSSDRQRAIFDRGRPHYVPGFEATYFVPFSGDREILRCRPSAFTTVYPYAEVNDREVVFRFTATADSDLAATKGEFERQLGHVRQYLGWAKNDIERFNAELPDLARERLSARIARLERMEGGLKQLGLPVRPVATAHGGVMDATTAERRIQPNTSSGGDQERYDVALSFAGENRVYVEAVAQSLKAAGVTVFYDKFEQAALWGKNLIDHLAEVYQKRSRYVVMFISEHYVRKPWPSHERAHAQARALLAREEYILPARFDDTEVPGLAGTVSHVDLRVTHAVQLADLILAKLGQGRPT